MPSDKEQTLNEKILDCVRDVTADTGNYGEYGGQNRQSQIDVANDIEKIAIQYAEARAIEFHHWKGLYAYFYDGRKDKYFPTSQDGLPESEIDYITPQQLYKLFDEQTKQKP